MKYEPVRFNLHRAGIKYEQGSQISQVPANPFPNSSGQLGRCSTQSRSSKQAAYFLLKPTRGREGKTAAPDNTRKLISWLVPRLRPPLQEIQHQVLPNATEAILNGRLFWAQARNRSCFQFLTQNFTASKSTGEGQGSTASGITEENYSIWIEKQAKSLPQVHPPTINPLSSATREMPLKLPQDHIPPHAPPRKFQKQMSHLSHRQELQPPRTTCLEASVPSCFRT